jgi:hypothetical protein
VAALERTTLLCGAVLAAHVPLQLVYWRCLRAPDDVERNGLVRVAAKAPNFQVAISRIERIAPSVGDGCAGPLKPSIRLFHASTASRSASRRASAARSAAARIEAPKRVSRDLVPMPRTSPGRSSVGKPLWVAVDSGPDTTEATAPLVAEQIPYPSGAPAKSRPCAIRAWVARKIG